MALVYGQIDSLSQLISKLNREHINSINNLDDIGKFMKDYDSTISKIQEDAKIKIINYKSLVTQQFKELSDKFETANKEHSDMPIRESNYIKRIILKIKLFFLKRKVQNIHYNFDIIMQKEIKNNTYSIMCAKRVIDSNYQIYLGAIGESEVVKELMKLSDEYVVINNFHYVFRRALHNKQTDEWIQSIQADHVLIGPSGVFIIETKNWSKQSINNIDLYSPVSQINRTSYAIFVLLNRILPGSPSLFNHWGRIKIPTNNIILMINYKPPKEFNNAKVLTLNQLVQYIKSSKLLFNREEVKGISDMLLEINPPNWPEPYLAYQNNPKRTLPFR